jgi:hypothetical protein
MRYFGSHVRAASLTLVPCSTGAKKGKCFLVTSRLAEMKTASAIANSRLGPKRPEITTNRTLMLIDLC